MSNLRGRPSKRPKLIRHGGHSASAELHTRHLSFALRSDGGFGLRTSYLPAPAPAVEPAEAPSHDDPILLWLNERETYLNELLYLEGRGKNDHEACSCGKPSPSFRCQDCFSTELFCHECVLSLHASAPLHRIEEWKDSFFHTTSLKHLSFRIQLGHKPGESCRRPRPAYDNDFVIIDVHGIHEVSLDFCNCEHEAPHFKQLLCARLFPATVTDPRTAATFSVLDLFHLLSFESKVSAYEFYHSLARRTDNTGIRPIRDRYSVFLRIMREWRNLNALKRAGRGHDPAGRGHDPAGRGHDPAGRGHDPAGRGHDPAGVDATQEGELTVLCPACPHPGINLPPNWETSDRQWLYAGFFAIDANFRLKRRLVSSDAKDPGLTRGWGYFVEEHQYKTYLAENSGAVQEKSTCVSHNAVNMADTKASKGLAATGVGTIDCARHDMKLPNGVGDLQKGEKYLNMDYIVFSALTRFPHLTNVNLSYDIACQWHKKLQGRIPGLPIRLQPGEQRDPLLEISSTSAKKMFNFFVPKFHLAAHIEACQTAFSFNWTPGEMGPGSRREILDDFFGDSNWKKITALGRIMSNKLKEVVKATQEHKLAFEELENSITESDLGVSSLATWKAEIEAWETNHTKPNPFEHRVDTMTLAAVCLKLVQRDARELEEGTTISLHAELSCSMLISTGIDLEHAQRRLRADTASLGRHATDTQRTKILTRSSVLQHCIDVWTGIQTLYMPSVANLRATGFTNSRSDDNDDSSCPRPNFDSGKAEDVQLLLPSEMCSLVPCDQKLLEAEWSLRMAQAHDALNECRSHIRLHCQLMQFKQQHIRGQGANTRAKKTLDAVEDHLIISHAKYVCACKALVALSDHVDHIGWERKLQPLKKSHLRPIRDFTGQSQGTAIMSWIWLTYGMSDDDSEGLQDSLRIEWCKARARRDRWGEEIQLLLEEMQHILLFLDWQARQWDERTGARVPQRPEDVEGVVAYAKKQVFIWRSLSESFKEKWRQVPVSMALGDDVDDGEVYLYSLFVPLYLDMNTLFGAMTSFDAVPELP
ncbi:uncharacterized protein F5147DRAFT_747814 [Suillus discolor]|uniref:CxC2-like cysteine cluster KDZ transposase-associated domain-containing protein n=1 Tax=Suillus discolor TaxID=1912936 RepID=A0A9P7JPA4_9AGAM|nr:uncharacterized protein F5147DRAFT_747814 [Suillus discolor]KAG2094383.1 hypothetical protein F5147DRAFT_747814 [Suillus discolor]